ncbi:uncharacterized protein F4822DRAFT_401544 [Hypoxylon trugodes]|uniref:uncharacterized protein n=1 Tax=Hypoxylon trugodes TaxID=326681 RepID=UPI002196B04E|nr:uncharacterized protein F4822DRAFT_401544 [Hypoxylon trugodes]KAI1390320.1 hypothetical protein F4822DRAFT_401544 [Hypoxylon trugodes]
MDAQQRVNGPANGNPRPGSPMPVTGAPLLPGVPEGTYTGTVAGPPPGLVRVTQPKQVTYQVYHNELRGRSRFLRNEHAPLFGDIAKFLSTGHDIYGNRIILNLTCDICRTEQLEVPPTVTPSRRPGEHNRLEQMLVLPCGHFFGFTCMQAWIAACKDRNAVPNCPACRFDLCYPECDHDIRLLPYMPDLPREIQVPMTIPEGGAIPAHCEHCRLQYVAMLSRTLADTCFPAAPDAVFRNPDRCGPVQFEAASMHFHQTVMDTYLESNSRVFTW